MAENKPSLGITDMFQPRPKQNNVENESIKDRNDEPKDPDNNSGLFIYYVILFWPLLRTPEHL